MNRSSKTSLFLLRFKSSTCPVLPHFAYSVTNLTILEQFSFMIKVLFICHGNICRSPMAEFLFKDMVKKRGIAEQFYIASAATSTEEIGNPVHRGTRNILNGLGISCQGKQAVQMTKADYIKYDYLIGMDHWNISNMTRIAGGDPEGKIIRLLDFTARPRDVADPWYTGDFNTTYRDIIEGLEAFLNRIHPEKDRKK